MPATVTWLGVTGRRATAAASRSALRRTQAWNLLVNIFDSRTRDLASAAVDVDDAGGDLAPGVAASLGQPAGSQSRAQVAVAGEHGERRAQLGRSARSGGERCDARLSRSPGRAGPCASRCGPRTAR